MDALEHNDPPGARRNNHGDLVITTNVSRYLHLWHGLIPELGFTVATLPIVLTSMAILVTGIAAGIGLVIVWLGIPVLVITLHTGRWYSSLELRRLEAAGRPPISSPDWHPRPLRPGIPGGLRSILSDGRYWIRTLHGAVVNPILGICTWSIVIVWLATALGGPTYWLWERWVQTDRSLPSVTLALAGLMAIATLPVIVHAIVLVHNLVARKMLGE